MGVVCGSGPRIRSVRIRRRLEWGFSDEGMCVSKRVTLADIAQATGLSAATVSMVLNKRPGSRISEVTAQRVRDAAASLGYSPDVNARGLRTGKSKAVGFLSDEVTITRYASAMIRGLLDASDERDHIVMMAECENGSAQVERAVRAMLSRRIDGLIFGQMRARRIEIPDVGLQVPRVVINGEAEGCSRVLPDEYAAGMEAVDHLVSNGHRRIAFIGRSKLHLDPRVSVTIGERLSGIDAGMERAGLRFEKVIEGASWEPELGYEGALQVFEEDSVTALLVANDRVALGAYQAAQERGLSVPQDVSIMSFDDEQLAGYLRPQVTTMRLPYLEMGEAGMNLLLDQIDGGQGGAAAAGDGAVAGESEGTKVMPYAPPEQALLIRMPLVERGSVRKI